MTKFRPCIDLHSGQVKQIVGGTLSNVPAELKTNYVSKLPASHYAELYQRHDLRGGHVVMLGSGNDTAAKEALSSWPSGLQVAGGITDKNAQYWIDQGAEKVIITSFLFPEGKFSLERLKAVLSALGGDRSKLVLDLSCRKKDNTWFVAMNRWQTITEMEINQGKFCFFLSFFFFFRVFRLFIASLVFDMKPVVSVLNAWSCAIISLFAIVILSVLGSLYKREHHGFTGSEGEPEDGAAVAASIFTAVFVYAAFFVFCSFQAYLHVRNRRGGAISLN
ncbi:Histidine biosynthesis protein [Aspergillus parasiticus SU-1]|uniref:1-(5-phosphoribosyl)-5-[(5-phosphoribosylamino)methylideneamino] imidazole-4-carboxamide isomerase n=4 Tax=Aspergillus subgen. Circumdati TaxID=2720871 RepID=A0A0F0I360_ASPPU|nr:Histidine biosynthesis protein [Aspergillus parasiticus SU-1]